MGIEGFSSEIDQHNYVESKIREVIASSKIDLANLSDDLHISLEGKLNNEHITKMLQYSRDIFENMDFSEAMSTLGAGYILPLQAKLKSLGYYHGDINGMYKGKNSPTYKAVFLFQTERNKNNPNDKISADGWAGKQTIEKIIQTKSPLASKPEAITESKKLQILPKDLDLSPIEDINILKPFSITSLETPSGGSYYTRKGKPGIYYVSTEGNIRYIDLGLSHDQILVTKNGEEEVRKNINSIEEEKKILSLVDMIKNPYAYKTGNIVEHGKKKSDISHVVINTFNMSGITEASILKTYEKHKDAINMFPVLSAYILYRSMYGLGTYDGVIEKIIEDNAENIQDIVDSFGTISGEDLIDWLIDDFGGISLHGSKGKLQKIIAIIWNNSNDDTKKIIASKNEFVDIKKNLYHELYDLIKKWDNEWFAEKKYEKIH